MIQLPEDRRPPLSPQLALRVAILGGIALTMFVIVFFRLWFLQVLSGEEYLVQARENRTRDIRIQAPRGEIVDRNGARLVDNRPANVVQIEPQDLPEQTIADAAAWGQAVGRRQRRRPKFRGPQVALPPVATSELRERYQRLGKVLGMRASTIHRRVIEGLAVLPTRRSRSARTRRARASPTSRSARTTSRASTSSGCSCATTRTATSPRSCWATSAR